MTIDELINEITKCRPYKKYDKNGLAQGCMLPIYLLYPDLPRFDWPDGDLTQFMETKFNKYAQKIPRADICSGDLILIKIFQGLLHPAVYLGEDRIIHCLDETGLQIMRFSWVRVQGVYRICRQAG